MRQRQGKNTGMEADVIRNFYTHFLSVPHPQAPPHHSTKLGHQDQVNLLITKPLSHFSGPIGQILSTALPTSAQPRKGIPVLVASGLYFWGPHDPQYPFIPLPLRGDIPIKFCLPPPRPSTPHAVALSNPILPACPSLE